VNGRNTKDRGPGLLEQSRWKSKQYHIYTLADPRDNLVRYTGITTDTKYRYRQHSRRGYNCSIWRWARELEHVGMSPVMRIVETINREAETSDNAFKQIVSEREAYWIGEYLLLGASLFKTFGVTKRYPHSRNDPVGEGLTTNKKRQEKHTRAQEEILSIKESRRDGYMTIDEIAALLDISVAKVRTIIARLDIQPRRFPDDIRKLYYSQEDIERMKQALGLK
jgi:predicted GIY-YIG superfamily endonuclease